MQKYNEELYKFLPGFTMGFTRSIISHPFEIMKLKSQMNINDNFFKGLFKGLHLSIISNSFERGIQFYWFNKIKKNKSLLESSIYASLISTSISLPYNIILLKKTILQDKNIFNKNILYKGFMLEYSRNIIGSSIFLYTYDTLRLNYPIIISSVFSSIFVWVVTYPIDNIKNKIIGNKKIIIYNLYKGIQYPIIRSIPSSIIGFYIYEYVNDYVQKKK